MQQPSNRTRPLLSAVLLLSCFGLAQQDPGPTAPPGFLAPPPAPPSPTSALLYKDMDLLRRDGFASAQQGTVSLRILDKSGVTPATLHSSDLTLTVNGSIRQARLRAPASTGTQDAVPNVLLVFPPNQPMVHHIALTAAIRYFSHQSSELLPWRVGLFDSNAQLTPFTNGRSQLLLNLDLLDKTVEPFQFASEGWSPLGLEREGKWLAKAEQAIATMQRLEGPKAILAMNPLSDFMYGENERMLEHAGPASLADAAIHAGAHIYIANVGGPEPIVPGGDAAHNQPTQINRPGGLPILGTSPSSHMQVDPAFNAALNYSAYRTSQMMQTAASTLGGFSNSLDTLARQIHHDLDANYALDFDLTPQDRDHGFPSVQVTLAQHELRVAILDITPIASLREVDRRATSKEIAALIHRATHHPVSSPDFHITQRVDYFPLRAGLEAVLPMSSIVQWTGPGRGPRRLFVVESVEDLDLSTFILERDIQAQWDGRSLSWERDGQLRPGRYLWRIALHDGNGTVLSTAEEKISVGLPRQTVAISSLALGNSCRPESQLPPAMPHHPHPGTGEADEPHLSIDPLRTSSCRLKPNPTDNFAATDTLEAMVRIYPAEKLDRYKPETWVARFSLRSASGAIESQQDVPFAVDSGSGYVAFLKLPLNASAITSGQHTLQVEATGPGIRHDLKQSRTLSIDAVPNP